MSQTSRILKKVRRGVQHIAYGHPLYQKVLAAGEVPACLALTPNDPWPGDASAGQTLLAAQAGLFETGDKRALRHAPETLRNLRAVGTDAARVASVRLIQSWLQQFDRWHQSEWQPDILGARIAAWIGFYSFYGPAADPDLTAQLIDSLYRQWRHLLRAITPSLQGVAAIQAMRGLVYGGLNFPDGDKALGLACDFLHRQLAAEILSDGGHVSRNPSVQLHLLQHLVDLQAVFALAGVRWPETLEMGMRTLAPAVKFFRHGDGKLVLFHGGTEETSLLIEAVLTKATGRGRVLRRLAETGYERLVAGRSLLIADAAAPPPRAISPDGHAGLLSFEFSHGRERLIVNCGSGSSDAPDWRAACAATAAHTTLTVEDTNACVLDEEGGVISDIHVTTQRFEDGESFGLDMEHDGYERPFGLRHKRTLWLSVDGHTLIGCDRLEETRIATGKPYAFTLRWHLHPSVQALIAQGGQTALLRTPSGSGWRLRVDYDGPLALEGSIYCGTQTPRRALQLKTAALTHGAQTIVKWSLTREGKK